MGEANKEEKRDLIGQFLKPNKECVFSAGDDIAFAVNQDWLEGKNYQEMVRIHQDEYERLSGGHDLTPTALAIHFTKHMDSRGAAVNKWARAQVPGQQQARENLPTVQDVDDLSLYNLHNRIHLNKFTAADSAVREMISNLEAMKKDIDDRRESGRTFDMAVVLKEYGKLVQGLHGSLLKAQEIDSKLEVNATNAQASRVLEFAALKSLSIGGKDAVDHPDYDDFVREAERLWLSVAVKHIVARLDVALKATDLDAPAKADVLVQVKGVMKGLDESVFNEYELKMKTLRDQHFGFGSIVEGVVEQKNQDGVVEQKNQDQDQ